jgi:hypothetical protein
MGIPRSQLETWANLGGTTASTQAYSTIQGALAGKKSTLTQRAHEIFLQGSYRNATNIYGNSDVDVVVLTTSVFGYDWSALPPEYQQHHRNVYPVPSSYKWEHWRADVIRTLEACFGTSCVHPRNKAIFIDLGGGKREADVVPAIAYRKYTAYTPHDKSFHFHSGIQLFDSAGRSVVNYPKQHIANGEEKNAAGRTGGRYKETVRIFKNMRGAATTKGILAEGVAPSYFVECLLSNVPDSLFVSDVSDRVFGVLKHLWTLSPQGLKSQNGLIELVGIGNTQWSTESYNLTVRALANLWDHWS